MSVQRYWLLKSEPGVFSIDDLQRLGSSGWDGVRNYQARNFMRDDMRVDDLALFYHSSADPTGVVGLARVAGLARPDPSQFDPQSHYYDKDSKVEEPRWLLIDVAFEERWDRVVTLAQLKADPALDGMLVTRRGQRLSIQPVSPEHFARVCELGRG
jgi:predicted RNA-binding protein with PUA-like domain